MRILIAECMQEISSFNPHPSDYDAFTIERGEAILRQRSLNTPIGGALSVFEERGDVELVAAISARAGSGGILTAAGFSCLREEILGAVRGYAGTIDALYVSLHGAMGAVDQPDPEGELLDRLRDIFGEAPPSSCRWIFMASSQIVCCGASTAWPYTRPILTSISPIRAPALPACCSKSLTANCNL